MKIDKTYVYLKLIEDTMYELYEAKEKNDYGEIKNLAKIIEQVGKQLKDYTERVGDDNNHYKGAGTT